jgi:hypothetical protein
VRRPFAVLLLVCVAASHLETPDSPEDSLEKVTYPLIVGGMSSSQFNDDELRDLATFARQQGLDLASVTGSFRGQVEFSEALDDLRSWPKSKFSQGMFESGEGYRAWVSFVGAPSASELSILADLPIQVEVRDSAMATEAELESEVEAAQRIAGASPGIDKADAWPLSDGTIQIRYSSHTSIDERALSESLRDDLAQLVDVDGDVQWLKLSSGTVTNKFQYDSTGSVRTVTAATNPSVGTVICRWGKTSGYLCGTVRKISYCDPSGVCKLFTATPSLLNFGDSGGPWWFGNNAAGISRGYVVDDNLDPDFDMATRVGSLNLIGLAVKVTP